MVLGTGFGLARMKNEGFGVKGSKLGSVTSRHHVTSRHLGASSKKCNFSVWSSFRILTITSSTDVQIG